MSGEEERLRAALRRQPKESLAQMKAGNVDLALTSDEESGIRAGLAEISKLAQQCGSLEKASICYLLGITPERLDELGGL